MDFPGDSRDTLLFLHGFPGDRRDSVMLDGFANANVASPDMPWIADATINQDSDMSLGTIAMDVVRSLPGKFRAPFHLCGHDLGGAVAWWVAALAPDWIASLTVVSCPHPAAYVDFSKSTEGIRRRDYISRILAEPDDKPLDTLLHMSNAPSEPQPRQQISSALDRTDPKSIRMIYRRSMSNRALNAAKTFPRLRCPVNLIFGACAHSFPSNKMEKSAEIASSGRTHLGLIEKAAHFVHLTHPERVAAIINRTTDGGGLSGAG